MRFEEIIKGLYSQDEYQIYDILNQGVHIDELNDKDSIEVIHTGSYYKTHKGRLFEILYIISTQQVCFQQPHDHIFTRPLGAPMSFYNRSFDLDDDWKKKWYISYDVQTGIFETISIKGLKRDSKRIIQHILLNDGVKIYSFVIKTGEIEVNYPLELVDIPQLYRGEKFEPINRGIEKKDEIIRPSYGKYKGTYVQDIKGYSDDFIDNVLDERPDAYWNID